MSAARTPRLEHEIARGLREVLDPVLAPRCEAKEIAAAIDVAHLLVLPGLERLLGALVAHAGEPWPAAVEPALDRLRRMHGTSAEQQSLAVFQESDREVEGLAGAIEGMEWAEKVDEQPASVVQAVSAADAIAGFPLERADMAEEASKVKLAAPVAAVVRAALDWLAGDAGSARPLATSVAASTFEITFNVADMSTLEQAHEVVASVAGNLSPAQRSKKGTRWTLRVPSLGDVPSYLMLIQGSVPVAVPWHAVQRVSLSDDSSEAASVPALPRVAPATASAGKRPTVLVALGLKRATLEADRIVWRLQAKRDETGGAPPAARLLHAVVSEDGERFWVVDLAALMESIAMPGLPEVLTAAAAAPLEPVAMPVAAPREVATPVTPAKPAEPARPEPRISDRIVLSAAQVEPIAAVVAAPPESEPAKVEPAPPAPAASPRPAAPKQAMPPLPPAPALHPPRGRRALVAEDSFTARLFLSRMLEQRGFEVRTVETAADMRRDLGREWALVCVDVELPDARGTGLVDEVVRSQDGRSAPAAVVALVRDKADVSAAAKAGVRRVLRKPYDTDELNRMLERIGLGTSRKR